MKPTMTQLVLHRTGDSRTDAPLYPSVTGAPHRIRSYDGAGLAALVAGDGPPLVLAHGSLVSSASWALMWRPLLDAGYRLIAYDLRGHGLSTLGTDGFATGPYPRDLAAVLEHFDVRDIVARRPAPSPRSRSPRTRPTSWQHVSAHWCWHRHRRAASATPCRIGSSRRSCSRT